MPREQTGPPDPSHDDVSNPGPARPNVPIVDNDAHDRNDDGPGGPDPASEPPASGRSTEQKIAGKPISDLEPPGQDASTDAR
jgi:hypothetical protein